MTNNPPMDPIARKLHEAVERNKAEADAVHGEKLLATDFGRAGQKAGLEEMDKLKEELRQRCESLNAQRPSGLPEFRYIPSGRVYVGKYALQLDRIEELTEFRVRVTVGLHPDAAQFMVEPPDIRPVIWTFRAETDESGFFWKDLASQAQKSNEEIVEDALTALSDLVAQDRLV